MSSEAKDKAWDIIKILVSVLQVGIIVWGTYITNKINSFSDAGVNDAAFAVEIRYLNQVSKSNQQNIKELLTVVSRLEANQAELRGVLIEYKEEQRREASDWKEFLEKYGPGLQYANRKAAESYGP